MGEHIPVGSLGHKPVVFVKPAGAGFGIQDDLPGLAVSGFPQQPGPRHQKTSDPPGGRLLIVAAPAPQGGDVLDFQPGIEKGGFQGQEKHPDDPAVHYAGEEALLLAAHEAGEQEPDVKEFQVDVRHLHQGVHAEGEGDEEGLPAVLHGAAEDHPVVPGGGRDPPCRVFRFQAVQHGDPAVGAAGGVGVRGVVHPFDGRVDLVRDHQPQPGGPDLACGPQEIPLPPAFDQLAFAEKLPVLDEQPALDGGGALVDEDELLDPDFFLVEKEMEIGVGGGVLGLGCGPDAAHPEQLVQCAADVGGPPGNGVDRLFYVLALDHGKVQGLKGQGVQGSRGEARPGTFFSLEPSTPWTLEPLCCGRMPLPPIAPTLLSAAFI